MDLYILMASSCIPYAEDEPKELGTNAGCRMQRPKREEHWTWDTRTVVL
jgi:hypothetical protein